MRSALPLSVFVSVFFHFQALGMPTDLFICELRTVSSKGAVQTLKVQVQEKDTGHLSLRFPLPDGIVRTVPAKSSALPIEDLNTTFEQVFNEMQGPECLTSPQCRSFAWKVERVHGSVLRRIRTEGSSAMVYAPTTDDSKAPTLFQVKNDTGEIVGTVGFIGWGQVGTCR